MNETLCLSIWATISFLYLNFLKISMKQMKVLLTPNLWQNLQ